MKKIKNDETTYCKVRTDEAWSLLCKILADENMTWEDTFNLMLTINARFLQGTAEFLRSDFNDILLLMKQHYIEMLEEIIPDSTYIEG